MVVSAASAMRRGPPAAGPVRAGNQPLGHGAAELPGFQAEIGGQLDRAKTPRRGHSWASGSFASAAACA